MCGFIASLFYIIVTRIFGAFGQNKLLEDHFLAQGTFELNFIIFFYIYN